jgi:hypothetical protein
VFVTGTEIVTVGEWKTGLITVVETLCCVVTVDPPGLVKVKDAVPECTDP